MSEQWGRSNDAGRWPWRGPRYTVHVMLLALLVGGGLWWSQFRQLTPLEQANIPNYLWSSVASSTLATWCPETPRCTTTNYAVLRTVEGPNSHMAVAFDLVRRLPNGQLVPLEWTKGPYRHRALRANLQQFIFDGQSLWTLAWSSIAAAFVVAMLGLFWAVPRDLRRWRAMREGLHLGGPRLVTNREFNQRVKGDGYGFQMGTGVKRWRH